MNQKVHMTFNFNCFVETEGLLEVLASHIHGTRGNIAETVRGKGKVKGRILIERYLHSKSP